MGVGRFFHHGDEEETPHSRVIRPGDVHEFVSVIHRNGSISNVEVSADNDDVSIGVAMAVGKELHFRDRGN